MLNDGEDIREFAIVLMEVTEKKEDIEQEV